MAFILSDQRDADVVAAFQRYREYLDRRRKDFPRGAYDLAMSDWYYDYDDHRCPHDAWLETLTVSEPATGARQEVRTVALHVRLLGSYHDGYIEFRYPHVFRYAFRLDSGTGAHRDWRYDEFRITEEGHLLHEIEWWGQKSTGRWIIESSDVEFTWLPK
jgi:hypothetical protein